MVTRENYGREKGKTGALAQNIRVTGRRNQMGDIRFVGEEEAAPYTSLIKIANGPD